MLEGLLQSIKGEKKMSLNHWRYRLLHWAFGVHPEKPWQSALPQFFYTHYCPLFHMTNLIAIFSPIILLVKVFIGFCSLVKYAVTTTVSVLDRWLTRFDNWRHERAALRATKRRVETRKPEEEDAWQQQQRAIARMTALRDIPKMLLNDGVAEWEFDRFYRHFCHCEYERRAKTCRMACHFYYYQVLTEEEVREVWDSYAPKIRAAKERAKVRKERMRARIIFWVNFSRVFIKAILNIFYFALFLLVAFVVVMYGLPALWAVVMTIGSIIMAMIECNYIALFVWLVYWLMRIIVAIAVFVALVYVVKWTRAYRVIFAIGRVLALAAPPFILIADMFQAAGRYIAACWNGTLDFIQVFYEENCPPIKIVDDNEAAIEEVE